MQAENITYEDQVASSEEDIEFVWINLSRLENTDLRIVPDSF